MWGAADSSFSVGAVDSKVRRSQNIIPATAKQLLECTDDTYKLEGVEAHLVTIVGLVRTVKSTITKLSMFLDDQTASIECIQYVGVEGSGTSDSTFPKEGTYGRVVGALRSAKDRKYLAIFKTSSVTDLNELTMHLLEVIQTGHKLRKLRTDNEKKIVKPNTVFDNSLRNMIAATGAGAAGTVTAKGKAVPDNVSKTETVTVGASPMTSVSARVPVTTGGPSWAEQGGAGATGSDYMAGISEKQHIVYATISHARGDQGIHRDQIIQQVESRLPRGDTIEILEFLLNEGHVYCTFDDDHFKAS